jgi:hypothetical protein
MNDSTDPEDLLQGGETTVRWLPRVNDPARPTAEEIAAGTVIGTVSGPLDLTTARDEDAGTDPRTLLEGRVERYRVERHRLDPSCEVVQIAALGPAAMPETIEVEAGDEPPDLDLRWNWVALHNFGERNGTTYVRGECRHLALLPLYSTNDELIAHVCLTCETAIPLELT